MPSSDAVAFVFFVFLPTSSSEAVAALRLLDDDEAIETIADLLKMAWSKRGLRANMLDLLFAKLVNAC